MIPWRAAAALAVCALAGCMTPEGKPSASSACSFEQVWETALVALADVPLETADKAAGILETTWVEVEALTQAGALRREVNRDRVKYVVEVKAEGRGAAATVLQLREEWSPMGARSRQWQAIPGNPSEEEALAATIARRLKEKGC